LPKAITVVPARQEFARPRTYSQIFDDSRDDICDTPGTPRTSESSKLRNNSYTMDSAK
jgi:hypothetical protein